MTPPVVYTVFGTGLSGFLTFALMKPTNSLTCAGGLLEKTDIFGNVEKCVNVLGSNLFGLVGAVDAYLAAGVVGAVVLVGGVIAKQRKSV